MTAPAALRRALGIDGGRVRFVVDDAGIGFEAAPPVSDLFGVLPTLPGTSDDFVLEMDEAVVAALAEKHG